MVHWVQSVLHENGVNRIASTKIHQDNLCSISLTEHVQVLRNLKIVEIKYHYVRDAVDEGLVYINCTSSLENLADSFTKVLIGEHFESPGPTINIRWNTKTS